MSCSAIYLDHFGNLTCKKCFYTVVNRQFIFLDGHLGQFKVNIKETEGFNMSRDTISIHFVNAALTGVKRLGMDVETLLSHVGIEAELLRQPKARISPEQYTRFIKMLWMVTQDEHVGFDVQPRRLGTFAIMCQLIIHAKTLGQALELSSQFYKLFGDEWSVTLERDKHEARLVPSFQKL